MRALLLATVVLFVACGDDPPKTYSTYQACFDDKKKQDLETPDAIVRCCLDHEIMGNQAPVCGNNDPECINFLTANLKQTDAEISVQMTACTQYIAEKNMQ